MNERSDKMVIEKLLFHLQKTGKDIFGKFLELKKFVKNSTRIRFIKIEAR